MIRNRKIFVAVPAVSEAETLPVFINCCRNQSFQEFKLIINVNQPDNWWEVPGKLHICENNASSLEYLRSIDDIDLEVIDRSSKGNGWKGKKTGVGWARKVAMDRVNELAYINDILISLDADTTFGKDYFQSVLENFESNPGAVALSVPYYHLLTGDELKDRAILYYEIYMRYYAINLWRIGNPYSFTAIGSAIVLPVRVYRAVGGITPHHSGEDFYFLQKLRKYGNVMSWNREKVYPAARYSDRVGFGTGPAMIRGAKGDWSSYPVYRYEFFNLIKRTTNLFPVLFEKDVETPMDKFLEGKFGENNIWKALRENYKTKENFIKACHHRIDALRILQFLKWKHRQDHAQDEKSLIEFMNCFFPEKWRTLSFDDETFSFMRSPVEKLDIIRNLLAEIEAQYQRNSVKK